MTETFNVYVDLENLTLLHKIIDILREGDCKNLVNRLNVIQNTHDVEDFLAGRIRFHFKFEVEDRFISKERPDNIRALNFHLRQDVISESSAEELAVKVREKMRVVIRMSKTLKGYREEQRMGGEPQKGHDNP